MHAALGAEGVAEAGAAGAALPLEQVLDVALADPAGGAGPRGIAPRPPNAAPCLHALPGGALAPASPPDVLDDAQRAE